MLNDFVSLLFPRCCIITQAPLAKGEEYMSLDAALKMPRFDPQDEQQRLLEKLYAFAPIDRAYAYYKFSKHNNVQKLLHHLKYKNCPEIGETVGAWFGHALQERGNIDFDVIVPVPVHKTKLRQRGYNQCDYIAQGLSNVLHIPWSDQILQKEKHTTSQTKKGRLERANNVSNVFTLKEADAARNKKILLVDDVITTGATLGICAQALLQGGCKSVSVAALAATEQ